MSWDEIIKGTNGSDIINGGSGDDFIQGRAGGDFLDGGDGNDTIQGNEGDDYIRGGAGNDFIHGGTGTDTAVYSGSVKDYTYNRNGEEFFLNHVGGSMIDGYDRLISIERLIFADAVIDLTQNNAPIAFADTASTDEDNSVSGNVLANDFDWEGDAMTATPGVFNGVYGTFTLNADGSYTYTPYASTQSLAAGQNVTDSFNYIVSDGSLSDIGTLTVTIAGLNDAPVANPDVAATGENSTVSINVLANDTDVDNGALLTVIAASAPVGQGSASVVANQVVFDPGSDFDHLDDGETAQVVISYTISDEHGATSSSTVTLTVNGANDAPVASDDTASTSEDASVSGNVLANDTDVDVETLTVANPGVYVGAYGTLTLAADGSYTYAPNAAAQGLDDGESAQDVFSYTASDGTASDSATLTVTVDGLNDAPVANDDTASTNENNSAGISGDVLANDTDVDGEALTVSDPGTYVGTYGTLVLAADGSYTYTPGAGAQGLDVGETAQDVFTYTASDGTASDTANLTVTITGLNDAPVANDDTNETDENSPVSGNVLANDTDVDGEPLTVTTPGTYNGFWGTLVLAADGSYTYTPNAIAALLNNGQSAVDVFNYIASDGTASDNATLTITINGLSGVPNAVDDTASTTEDNSVSGNVLANDTDAENDPLTVTNPGTYVGTYGTLTLDADGSYTYTPDAAANGMAAGEVVQDVFTYTATDGGASDTATLTVTVNGTNDAPTITGGDFDGTVTELPDGDEDEGEIDHSTGGVITFDDVDLTDTHSASVAPQGGGYYGTFTLGSVDQTGDNVGWTFTVSDAALEDLSEDQEVTQVYTITIDDGHGGTVTQDVTITINGTGVGTGPQTVWYIDNSAVGSTNVGTSANPFTSIAAFNAAQGTLGGPQIGHTVHLLAGTGTGIYAEADGINLLSGQTLIGDSTGPVRPTIEAAAGDGINVAQNNSISGVDIGNTSGADIADSGGNVGTLTISDVGTSGTGQVIDIDQGGTLDVTLNSAVSTASSGGAIDLAGVGGTFTVTGATTIAGVHSGGGIDITGSSVAASFDGGGTVATLTTTAVNYVGNSGSLHLGGGLDIVTTSGAGLNASGGGTIDVTGAGNSVTSTTGTAVAISGTAIGAAGVTLESVSANGSVNGIVLANTGNSGFFLVSGDESQTAGLYDRDGSGGTIQNTTGDGISLTNAFNVTIRQMNLIANGQTAGEDAVDSNGGGSIILSAVSIDTPGDYGWRATNLSGVSGVDNNSRIANWQASQSNGVAVINTNTDLTSFTVEDSLFTTSATGGDGFFFDANGTTSGAVLVLDSEFTLIDQDAVQINNDGSGTIDAIVQGSNFHDADATGGDGNNTLFLALSGSGTLNFQIGGLAPGEGNSFNNLARGISPTGAIAVNAATVGQSGSELNGWIEGNTITNIIGRDGISIGIEANGGTHGTHAIEIEGNTITNTGLTGLRTIINSAGGGSITETNLSIIDNVMTGLGSNPLAPNDSRSAIDIKTNWDNFASGGDMVTNLLIQDNVVQNNAASGLADTLEIAIRGGNAGTDHTANITLLGNDFSNTGGTSVVDIFTSSTVSGSGIILNLDMNSDNVAADANDTTSSAGAAGSIQLRNTAAGATFGIEDLGVDPAAAFVSARNSGDSVTIVGLIVSTGEATMPASPDVFWP